MFFSIAESLPTGKALLCIIDIRFISLTDVFSPQKNQSEICFSFQLTKNVAKLSKKIDNTAEKTLKIIIPLQIFIPI